MLSLRWSQEETIAGPGIRLDRALVVTAGRSPPDRCHSYRCGRWA